MLSYCFVSPSLIAESHVVCDAQYVVTSIVQSNVTYEYVVIK